MINIFEIKDKTDRKIRLSEKQWRHIKQRHPGIESNNIEETLISPLKTIAKEGVTIYYKYFKHRKEPAKYLKVVVKYLNGDGFVVTSYFVIHTL